mmetsp:Transcript_5058/g.10930  ORF Transcript_5058/g.10930 Transcript_5058/m.10930 type:complete len:101 (-) Transcript_5058:1085-1387(-)
MPLSPRGRNIEVFRFDSDGQDDVWSSLIHYREFNHLNIFFTNTCHSQIHARSAATQMMASQIKSFLSHPANKTQASSPPILSIDESLASPYNGSEADYML